MIMETPEVICVFEPIVILPSLQTRDVFLPKIRESRYSSKGQEVKIKPLFPNYLFAHMAYPDDYYAVIWAKGVRRIVGDGTEPIPLDDTVVDFFKKQTEEKGFMQPSSRLKTGDTVRVRNGALEGIIGIIDGSIDEKGRIKVLMDFLKESARIEIPYSSLERYWELNDKCQMSNYK